MATTSREPGRAPAADPGLRVLTTAVDGSDPALDVPPDAVLTYGPVTDLPVQPGGAPQ